MRYSVLALLVLLIAAAVVTGCTQNAAPAAPAATPAPAAPPAVATTAAQPSFTLGDHFFEKKYSWQDGKEVYTEMFVVKQGQPWGIGYEVTPLNNDPAKCWYEVTITDVNTNHAESFGYGRSYPAEKNQIHPLYGYGSYKVDMKGNYVMVNMKAAKRNP